MRMAEDKSPQGVCVSLLREQIKEKINASLQKDASHVLSGNAVPIYPLPQNNEPPPVPPHRSKSEDVQLPTTRPSKPPVAPKPQHISRNLRRPTILVSDGDNVQNEFPPFVNLKPSQFRPSHATGEGQESEAHSRRVRDAQRPRSTVSTTSTENGESADISDSDSEDGRQNGSNLLHRTDPYLGAPEQISPRRPSVLCFNGDPSIHEKIVDELKRQGIIRSSDRLMKKRSDVSSTDVRRGRDSLQPTESSPSCNTSVSTTLTEDTLSTNKKENAHSSRSSIVTTTSAEYESVPDYNSGDVAEDKRLKKLHYAANEFYSVQKVFLKYLRDMGEVYPEYVTEFGKRLGKDLLARQGTQLHVVRQLQLHFEQLIRFHQLLLDEFSSRLDGWSSLNPNMADIIIKYADFLKICKPFLLEKSRFVQELTQLRLENKDFDNATVAFEQKIFNRGVGAVVQQLDQIHQNFMRYKILMMSYNNYLVEGSDEQKKTLEAIAKLEKIAQSVNESMGLPSNEELFKLYDRFQCHFDVFYPGRRLIRQGEVLKQTRKEPQPRYLVLFSDTLWICRVMSGFGSSGLFDMGRSYRIPIETVRTESSSHEDYEQQLYVKSKYKSLILIMSSARERSLWQKDIDNAREEKRKYKRRMSEAIERQRRQSLNPLMLEAPLCEAVGMEDTLTDTNATIVSEGGLSTNGDITHNLPPLTTSRCNSDSQESSSHPSTPVDDQPGPSCSVPVTSKRKVVRSDTMKPLWIPDDSSSKCLMEGCDTVFSFLNRRHHCRDCGWLICSACVGKAPLSKFQFKKEIVCPECYDRLECLYNAGTLFPTSILLRGSDGLIRIRVPKGGGVHDKRYVVVEPQSLFLPPINRGLKRMNIEKRMVQDSGLVFGKVLVKNAKGGEIVRHAQLLDGMVLKFYKAPFDDEPCEQYVIYGFELKEIEMESGGTQFELTHRNQIMTDRKEHVISFRVEHEKSILKWSNALRHGLGIE
ncbi:hypothetical protein V3C99_008444 [Haemonchus contortus]|uniref:FYVE, RhoGEF and PH domain-containing protein 6 n=1 Tax=Haemonchus contortus TaxID=6289 RepID=A0A7I4YKQ3_HAECO